MIWFAPFCALGDEEPNQQASRPKVEPPPAPGAGVDDEGGAAEGRREPPEPPEPRASRR